jgi:hypothetical protein
MFLKNNLQNTPYRGCLPLFKVNSLDKYTISVGWAGGISKDILEILCSPQLNGSATWYSTHVSSTALTTVLSDPLLLDSTSKVRAPHADRRSGAPHMYWPHENAINTVN